MAILILNSGRCSHGKCFFCGYGRIRGMEPTYDNVMDCMRSFFETLGETEVKVFGSGSFLDERQVPSSARRFFIDGCRRRGVKKVTIESRPEFIKSEILDEFQGFDLTVAMGLESADDRVLKKLNKGYGKVEYEAAAKLIHTSGFKVRTYLLVNPPFVTDPRKCVDEGVEYALKHSDTVVLINMLPHANAPLSRMWANGEWNYLTCDEFAEAVKKWTNNPRVDLDPETFRFIPSFSDDAKATLDGVGEWFLTHPHFEVWQDYLVRWYHPPKDRIALFLPCAYQKPYSESSTHLGIINRLSEVGRSSFHEIMLSNAGVIPREFEARYPFESYDWDESKETPEIKKRYIEVTRNRIRQYLNAHRKEYKMVVCFLKYKSESYQALRDTCEELRIPLKNLLNQQTYDKIGGHPRPLQTEEALKDLEEGLIWCLRSST